MLDIIARPLGWIMRICYSLVDNYLLALLLFAVIMQIILLPFSVKQQKNSVRQAQLAPKLAALRKKYAGRTDAATQQKMQTEMTDLYQREGYNPASGCLPLLIQMPILLALYNVVINPLRYIGGLTVERIGELQTYLTETLGTTLNPRSPYISVMNKVKEIIEAGGDGASKIFEIAPELETAIIPDMSFLNFDVSVFPNDPLGDGSGAFWSWYLLIPVLTVVFHFITQKITRMFTYQSPETLEAQNNPSMKIMNWSMPLLSAWIAWTVPAAIGIYWMFRGILMAIQQIILSKVIPTPRFTEEDYKKAEKEMKAGKPAREKSKIPPKSLHRIDDEEYQAEYRRRLAEAEAEEAKEKKERALKDGVDTTALKEDRQTAKKNSEKTENNENNE